LSAAGIRTGISCSPVLPGITDSAKNLEGVVKSAAGAGAKGIFANPLFLKPCSAAVFMPFLQEEFPKLYEEYRKRYEKHAFLPKAYHQRISELMKRLREKHGLGERRRADAVVVQKAPQMSLF
jgi:DNA repair photolyase